MKFLLRFILLATGFSLFTFGLLEWSRDNFVLHGLIPFTADYKTQGMHYLMLGLAMIPPSLWEIFNLERRAIVAVEELQRTSTVATEDSAQQPQPSAREPSRD